MIFEDFIRGYINKLNDNAIGYSLLRNYEKLPKENIGNDIDFLILSGDVGKVIKLLMEMEGVKITGYVERPYVVSIFVTGVIVSKDIRAIQLDFFTSLSWKGLAYLPADVVINSSRIFTNNGLDICIPQAYHEAVNTFFGSYLIGGWIKEKYQDKVIKEFVENPNAVKLSVVELLGEKLSDLFILSIQNNDREKIMDILPKIKKKIIVNELYKSPINFFLSVSEYFYNEVKIRYFPFYIDSICFMGTDGAGKSTVIEGLMKQLYGSTKSIAYQHLKPNFRHKADKEVTAVADPQSGVPRGALLSSLKMLAWVCLYWVDRFFHGYQNLTLKIWDRYYYDVLVDPLRYRYGAPLWVANVLGYLVPKPGLILIVDAPTEIVQARKKEVSFEETCRQRKAYLEFSKHQKNCIVIDTSKNISASLDTARSAVIDYLEARQLKRLTRRIK